MSDDFLSSFAPQTSVNAHVDSNVVSDVRRNNVKFGHVNIRSLLKVSSTGSRIDKMLDFVAYNNIKVLALTETHLSDNVDDSEVYMNDFQFFS